MKKVKRKIRAKAKSKIPKGAAKKAAKKTKKRPIALVGYKGDIKFIGDIDGINRQYLHKEVEFKKGKKFRALITCQNYAGCDVVLNDKKTNKFLGMIHFNDREYMRKSFKLMDKGFKMTYPSGKGSLTIRELKKQMKV